MGDRFNTVAGWALFAGIIALGGAIVSSKVFHDARPETMGYAIEGVEAEGEGGVAGPSLNTLLASADLEKGAKVFGKCKACHKLEDGANATGPYLFGIVNRPVDAAPGFSYSGAFAAVADVWSPEHLDGFLKDPKGFAPGTKMSFAGLKKPEDRANVIAYLESISN